MYLAVTESWNGSSWAEVADLNTAVNGPTGTGTAAAALSITGSTASPPAGVEEWSSSSNVIKVITTS